MTIDDRTAAVIRRLIDRTDAGGLEWREFGASYMPVGERQYQVGIAAGGGRRFDWIVGLSSTGMAPDRVDLRVLRADEGTDGDGMEIFSAEAEEGRPGREREFELLRDLFEAARRSTAGWDAALDEIEAALAGAT